MRAEYAFPRTATLKSPSSLTISHCELHCANLALSFSPYISFSLSHTQWGVSAGDGDDTVCRTRSTCLGSTCTSTLQLVLLRGRRALRHAHHEMLRGAVIGNYTLGTRVGEGGGGWSSWVRCVREFECLSKGGYNFDVRVV